MLPCVFSVIDHRWRQNLARTNISVTRGNSWVCHWCSYHILTSFVIYYWTDTRQHGIYLFYTIKKLNTTEKSFFKNSKYFDIIWKPAFAPYSNDRINTKKGIWLNLMSIQLKQSHWLLCVANEFWLAQENRATVKLDDSSGASHGMKTYSESRIELQNLQILKKIVEKMRSFCLIRAAL